MTFKQYEKLCLSYGMHPYDNRSKEKDYGYWTSNNFYVVCGYRSKRRDFSENSWRDGSLIFYENGSTYNGKFFTRICDRLKEELEKEIKNAKIKMHEERIEKINRDFQ